jgi:hypothetical protein
MRLRELLSYDPQTGEFRWLVKRGRTAQCGAVAGTLHRRGYIQVRIAGRGYLAHRLAWFFTHDVWPREQIDHINSNKTDNRIINLREATHQQNEWNRGPRRDNTSGIKGVFWAKRENCWRALICINNKRVHLGLFNTKEEAARARAEADEKYQGAFRYQR